MYETYTTVQGWVVADPVVKQGRTGAFTTFRVAQSSGTRCVTSPAAGPTPSRASTT